MLAKFELLVPHLDGRTDLPFVKYEGLRMEDASAGQDMAIDSDGGGLSAWI